MVHSNTVDRYEEGMLRPRHTKGRRKVYSKNMPHRTYTYVFLKADSRKLEMYLSIFTVGWGLLYAVKAATMHLGFNKLAALMTAKVLGVQLWCLTLMIMGVLQYVAIKRDYPRHRMGYAFINMGIWGGTAVAFTSRNGLDGASFTCWALMLGYLWIAAHRKRVADDMHATQ